MSDVRYDAFCQTRRMLTSASGPKLNQAALPRDASTTKRESDLPSSDTRRLRTALTVCWVERIQTLCTRRWAEPKDMMACSRLPQECDLTSMTMANWASLPSGTSPLEVAIGAGAGFGSTTGTGTREVS